MKVYDRFFVENGYLEQVQGWGSGTHYQATEKGRENPAITNKLSNALMIARQDILSGISHRKHRRNSLAFPKTRRCRRAMQSISTTGRIPIPKIMTGNLIPIM